MLYLFWYVIFVLRCCFLDNSVSGVYICAYLFSVQWCVVYICVPVSYHLSLSARLTHWHTIVCSSPLLLSIHWLWHVSMTLVYTVRYTCFSHLSMTLSLRASQCGGELRVTAQHRALAHCSALTALLTCAHCSADTHTHTLLQHSTVPRSMTLQVHVLQSMTLSLGASQCGDKSRVTAQRHALAHCSVLTALLIYSP